MAGLGVGVLLGRYRWIDCGAVLHGLRVMIGSVRCPRGWFRGVLHVAGTRFWNFTVSSRPASNRRDRIGG